MNTETIDHSFKNSVYWKAASNTKGLIEARHVHSFDDLIDFNLQQNAILCDYMLNEKNKFDLFYKTNPTKYFLEYYLNVKHSRMYDFIQAQYGERRVAVSGVRTTIHKKKNISENMVRFVRKQQEDMNSFITG